MNPLKIVFAGTPDFGIPCLDAIILSDHALLGVYTQPDRPAGRGQKLHASSVKSWAQNRQVPVFQPENFKDPSSLETLKALEPDIMVVIAYGLILPKQVLSIPRLGCINVHASLLPAFRGAAPIQHAILQGLTETGVSIMQMDAGMDTGAILAKATCEINSDDTAKTLQDKLSKLAVQPLMDTLEWLATSTVYPEEQLNILATYAGKIKKEDAGIDWDMPAQMIHNQIRAYNPWPIAWTKIGNTVLRVYFAEVSEQLSLEKPGTIVHIHKTGIGVATQDKILLIQQLQFPGGKVMAVADWLNAGKKQLDVGMILR